MENWGLVLYRETALLYEPGVSSSENKLMVTLIVAHEVAHTVRNHWLIHCLYLIGYLFREVAHRVRNHWLIHCFFLDWLLISRIRLRFKKKQCFCCWLFFFNRFQHFKINETVFCMYLRCHFDRKIKTNEFCLQWFGTMVTLSQLVYFFQRFDNMPIRHFSYHSISGSLNMVTKQKFPTILFFQFFDDMMTLCHYFLLIYQFGNIVSISLVLIVLFFQWFGKGVTTSMSLFPVFRCFSGSVTWSQWNGGMTSGSMKDSQAC